MTKVVVNNRTCCTQQSGAVINRGDYDASSNTFPSPSSNGFQFRISVPGILGGRSVDIGAMILKLNNNDDQSLANWRITD